MTKSTRIKRRLEQIELEAARRSHLEAVVFEAMQRGLCCPLPIEASPAETDEAWQLLALAKAALPDQSHLSAFRDFAIRLHRKYGGPFADEGLSR